jgi:UDP-N-acetylglucosamine--N-acetylmuramyl-(pentapeptide) pyrophosphoryl-undecaprenol N-acetylglucosamine transferase
VVARNLVRMWHGMRQCQQFIRDFRPDAILITGGYVAAPVALAAWRGLNGRRVPLLIYLPDLAPGLSIRLTSRLAQRVAISFPEVAHFFGSKAVVTGYPVRPELLQLSRADARKELGLNDLEPLPVLLVFGGSRGARSINQALAAALPELLPHWEVIHVSGQLDWPNVAQRASELPEDLRSRYHAYPYLHEEMLAALRAADLAVARAGASTLGEFPAVGLPSILVPYPYAGQHQGLNAAYLADRGAAIVLPDGLLSQQLAVTVESLRTDPERLDTMRRAALGLSRPDAAANLAQQLRIIAGG